MKNKFLLPLCICLIFFVGCELPTSAPIGGESVASLSDFVGYSYISEYGEEFNIVSIDSSVLLTIGMTGFQTEAKVIEAKVDEKHGTFYLLQCLTHSNWQCAQYPDYAEENPHNDCYTVLYVPSISAEAVSWATFYLTIEEKGTACFKNKTDAQKYMYYDKTIWAYLSEGGRK